MKLELVLFTHDGKKPADLPRPKANFSVDQKFFLSNFIMFLLNKFKIASHESYIQKARVSISLIFRKKYSE